ncbi:fimbrial protein [Providencia sp. Je.9.19]|uniref:fimbrial protein n=1 Tax=Providencia sp. Je.9.19 TaxID=3142844 RepID=UPI003DA94169
MSITTQWRWYVGIGLLFTASYASAACNRSNAKTYELDMRMGRVVVNPNLQVGDTIAEQRWTMSENSNVTYGYCDARTAITAQVIMPNLAPLGNKVYQTNVAGIGMKFHREGAVRMTYPDVFYTPSSTNYYLAGSVFILTLIKTAPITGSGTIASGNYTSYGYIPNNNPWLVTKLNAEAITIVSPSCQVEGGTDKNVFLDPIKRSELKGRGTTAGERNFDITLRCSGGVSVSGFANVKMTFNGENPVGISSTQGVLVNQAASSAANGVGIQVLERGNKKPLSFNSEYIIGRLVDKQTQNIDLKYIARYYQYGSTISSGEVKSKMVFDITYD